MTQREVILASIRSRAADIDALGVQTLMLFGSVAAGEDTPTSDVDVLVQFDGPATFDGYMDLKFLLEDTKRAVILTVEGGRHVVVVEDECLSGGRVFSGQRACLCAAAARG